MSEPDSVMHDLREQISEIDRSIFDAVNHRLKLVAQLKAHKDEHGISFIDPQREESMLAAQSRANEGPLSDEGLRAFYAELLALTKRELS
jgi:chorismate mutase/prephenate dehydratase